MRRVLRVEARQAKHKERQPQYPGRTSRDVESFERATAGLEVDDSTPKAWVELAHPQTVLVTGLLSLAGIGWLLWHILLPGP